MPRRLGIRKLILIMGLLPVLTLSLGLSTYLMYSQIQELRNMMTERAKTSIEHLAIIAEHMLASDHGESLQQIATAALEEQAVRAVGIYNAKLERIAQAGPRSNLPDEQIVQGSATTQLYFEKDGLFILQPIFSPAEQNSPPLGWVGMQFNWQQLEIQQYQTLLIGTVFLICSIIICILLCSYINQLLTRDLNTLRQTVRRMTTGPKNFHAHMPSNDEFSEIAEELNLLNNAQQNELQELQRNIEQSNTDLRETLETVEVQNIELDLARREAVNASRIKSEFLANTSHEIRTPLNGIIGFSNILLKSELEIRQREAIETINSSANSLLTIINDILDFSKLEAGKLVLDSAPVNLRELIEGTLQILAPGATDKSLELILTIQQECPKTVLADALRLKQILTNLINNAIKFTQAGHILINVLSSDHNEQHAAITIQVSDTGIGLSKEQQKKIFKDFAQADASITRQYGGTGLGLVIVKGLIEQMGGEIGIESELGKGTTFWFTINFPIAYNAIKLRDFTTLKNKSVELYDPSPLHANSLKMLFNSWGLVVRHYSNIDHVQTDADYLVICVDNHDERAANFITRLNCPAIILSPYTHDPDESDQHYYLSKPISHIKLFDALNRGIKAATRSKAPAYSNVSILAVDDNPSNLHILERFLSDLGVTTTRAKDGSEAIQRCTEQCFDLIFMDIQMPKMDGIETSCRIRANGLNRETPIIALSAYLSPENPLQLREAGINDYLSKPITEHQLDELLHNYVVESSLIEVPRPVDISQCLKLSKERPALAAEMLGMLLECLVNSKSELIAAQQHNDLNSLTEVNHSLKGACCYTGTPILHRRVIELEEALQNSHNINNAVVNVIAAIDELLQWQGEHELSAVFES
ncbi:two-component system sensor histidine kinase BarA [Zhongshania antarctica]|uniref:histidine kinase n=1 Tax=Zhongshania antarctica TaxID=641702 RepID=A0A840R420_9GAMM|nr:ATP-binding protein [Zhongshania antarctica]MBB5187276.1 two-component system sensor histidine kinase BarA [Zhongshania antarctica]